MASKKAPFVRTATEVLKVIWEEGFFRTWRKFSPIEEHLGKSGYHFSVPELGMALKRAKHLTRRGKKGSYEYVQKYPFVADETHPALNKRKPGAKS